ncbi:MAG: inorganic phosphate transporter [Myxococcales bacterium]|nr:inorganic phosphate transporter [Myxococcales bacterium]
MNALFDHGLSTGNAVLLFVCLGIALGFEFVNGFHDTANAVATVIYTHSLKPTHAVVLSGICNFLGVFSAGISVALGLMKLLPVELLVSSGTGKGLAMVLAMLIAAILWNLATWYKGLPASSSHTLIGAILGVGIANSLLPGHHFGDGVNWQKAGEIGISLIVSPLFGFAASALLLVLTRRFAARAGLLEEPPKDQPPPFYVRALLVATCSGVSFAHGSNDGQKGVGLVMLILMGLVPASYALNLHATDEAYRGTVVAVAHIEQTLTAHADAHAEAEVRNIRRALDAVSAQVSAHRSVSDIPREQRFEVRGAILRADKALEQLVKHGGLGLTESERRTLDADRKAMRKLTDYAPQWVLFVIALALGVGTMFGWRRIVVTVGEKIGKSHLTYAQGAAAELVAASTIGFAAVSGLPVSTTHVLSSGIAGTMVANGSGVNLGTLRNIGLAWIMTLPVVVTLSGVLFLVFRAVLT